MFRSQGSTEPEDRVEFSSYELLLAVYVCLVELVYFHGNVTLHSFAFNNRLSASSWNNINYYVKKYSDINLTLLQSLDIIYKFLKLTMDFYVFYGTDRIYIIHKNT